MILYFIKPAQENFTIYDFPSTAVIYACDGQDSAGNLEGCDDAYPNDGVAVPPWVNDNIVTYDAFDFDQNGEVDPLTDGLLLLRHFFGLRGGRMAQGVVAINFFLTSQEIQQAVEDVYDIADIDGDGQLQALTDGLLIMRYLFEIKGESSIKGVISSQGARTDSAAIEAYLANYITHL